MSFTKFMHTLREVVMRRSRIVFFLLVVLLFCHLTPNVTYSSDNHFYGYSCGEKAEEYFAKVGIDGYVMGKSILGTKAFSFYHGKSMEEAEAEMSNKTPSYESYDCAHFVSSCMFRWGRYYLPNDYKSYVDGFVSASKLYNHLIDNDRNHSYEISDALRSGLISIGDPVFFYINESIRHSAIYIGGEKVAYHSNSNINHISSLLNNGFTSARVVHINNNFDDYKDTNDKFYYDMQITVNEKASSGLRIRENHSLSSRIIGSAYPGDVGIIIDSYAVFQDERYWWHVTINNISGWCAGEYLKRY